VPGGGGFQIPENRVMFWKLCVVLVVKMCVRPYCGSYVFFVVVAGLA
jgi:hypothetical protein